MPNEAQYEPDDTRVRALTDADSALWTLALFAQKNKLPLGLGAGVLITAIVIIAAVANTHEANRVEGALAIAMAKSVQDYEKVITQWPGSEAATQALFYVGNDEFLNGDYPKALETYRKLIAETPEHFLAASAQLGIAATLEAQKEIPLAIAAYQDLLRHYSQSHHTPEAQLGIGRCYELQENWEKAKRAYDDLIAMSPVWADLAQKRMYVVKRHLGTVPTTAAAPANPIIRLPAAPQTTPLAAPAKK